MIRQLSLGRRRKSRKERTRERTGVHIPLSMQRIVAAAGVSLSSHHVDRPRVYKSRHCMYLISLRIGDDMTLSIQFSKGYYNSKALAPPWQREHAVLHEST
jgi:hypothetical protein